MEWALLGGFIAGYIVGMVVETWLTERAQDAMIARLKRDFTFYRAGKKVTVHVDH